MARIRKNLSREWIAQELAQTFQLPLLSVPVQLGTNAFLQLARHQKGKRERPRQLPPHLWTAVREEACQFCLQTLAELMGITQGPHAVSPEQATLYDAFLTAVRCYLESPPPALEEPADTMPPSERIRYEQGLWSQAREALALCERWRHALLQHKVPEDRAVSALGSDLQAGGEAEPKPKPDKQRTALRRQHARGKQRAVSVRAPEVGG